MMKKTIIFLVFAFSLLFILGCVDQQAANQQDTGTTQEENDCSIVGQVCGTIDVECFAPPCDPITQTFENECEAFKYNAYDIERGPC